jgi:probable HAF family extracellular repeat protein
MNIPVWKWIAVSAIVAMATTIATAAQDTLSQHRKPSHHTYKLVDLGTLGGPGSYISNPSAADINNHGTLNGWADLPVVDPFAPNCYGDCFVAHAFRWKDGIMTDLGALPGGGSSAATWINDHGVMVGASENGLIDPLTGFPEEEPIVWRNGEMIQLPTLAGAQGSPGAINDRGQIAGSLLNTVPDLYSSAITENFALFAPAATQVRAVLWENDKLKDIGTLGGDDAASIMINGRGQATGLSYTNATPNPATGIPTLEPFLWEAGRMRHVGTLGGAFGYPNWLNNRGEIVGQSDLAGDLAFHPFLWSKESGIKDLGTLGGASGSAFWVNDSGEAVGYADLAGSGPQLHHAFLWKHGTMTDLGTVDGDVCSTALSINIQGQITGASTSCMGYVHGFLWEEGGPMTDLNLLVEPPSPSLRVMEGDDINDRGEIAGKAVLANGKVHAVLLIPNGRCEDECSDRIARSKSKLLAAGHAASNEDEAVRNTAKDDAPATSTGRRFPERFHINSVRPKL